MYKSNMNTLLQTQTGPLLRQQALYKCGYLLPFVVGDFTAVYRMYVVFSPDHHEICSLVKYNTLIDSSNKMLI